jgi:hypothetical protein
LYNQANFSQAIGNAVNAAITSANIAGFQCPSDGYSNAGNKFIDAGRMGPNQWGRGNYAASGYGPNWNSPPAGYGNQGASQVYGSVGPHQRGVMGYNGWGSIASVTDGTSNTVCSWEIRAGLSSTDPRGLWASSRIGAGFTGMCNNSNGSTNSGDCYGINEGNHADGDDILGCVNAPQSGMGCHAGGDGQSGPKSQHVGGVHALMTDGTVKFVNQNMDGFTMAKIVAAADGNPTGEF